MSVSYWLDRSTTKAEVFDVVVVGAGIAGFSAAYWLQKEDPNLKIALVDKKQISGGATGRNAGFITCGSVEHFNRLCERWGRERALEMWHFSEMNLELLKNEVIQDQQNMEFDHSGTFSLASTSEEFGELKKTAQLMADMDIAVDILSESEIKSRLGVAEFVGGIKYLKDASVNPTRLVQGIREKLNIQIFENEEMFSFHTNSRGSVEVRTEKRRMECAMMIMATNGYSADLSPYFADKIFPTRGQIMVTEAVPKFMEGPCYANFVLDYFRQLADGRVLIGGFRQLEKTTEVGYSDHTTDVIQSALYDFLQKHIPVLSDKKVTHRWAGVMGFSFDGQPMVGSLPNDPQVFFHGGFTGHGMGLAFHTGKSLVDLIYGRTIPNFISARRA